MKSVIYATNASAPYKVGMLNALSKRIPELLAIYLTPQEYMRKWSDPLADSEHAYIQLNAAKLNILTMETAQYFSLRFLFTLLTQRPKAVIFAPYSQIVFMLGFVICKLRGIPALIWYESHESSSIAPSLLRRFGKFVRKLVLCNASAIVVPGKLAKTSALNIGVHSQKIFLAPHSIRNELFSEAFINYSPSSGFVAISRYIKNYDRVLIYVGQFVARKNLDLLISTFIKVKSDLGNCCLILIGDDPEKITTKNPDILVAGFLEGQDIARVLHLSNGLVLPSLVEVWGLVVNEAAAAGLPVIVSTSCGAHEVVHDHITGYHFEARDAHSLAGALRKWRNGYNGMDRNVIRELLTQKYNFEQMAIGFEAAIKFSTPPTS